MILDTSTTRFCRWAEAVLVAAVMSAMVVLAAGCSDDASDGHIADTSRADTSMADTGAADTGAADTGAADTGAADTMVDAPADAEDAAEQAGADVFAEDVFAEDGAQSRPDAGLDVDAAVDLAIDQMTPARGPLAGGTPFVIEGRGLTDQTLVYLGSTPADAALVDGTLVGQTPPGPATGPVAVKLLDPSTGDANLPGGFTYTAGVDIDGVDPARLPTTGGVEVRVSGHGFGADTRVSFGGRTGLRHMLVDTDLLRVIAPPHAAGAVDIRATGVDGADVVPAAITYVQELGIDGVFPASGPAAGGQTARLVGRGFTDDIEVQFGGVAAVVDSVGPAGEAAVVTTPAGRAGLVDVGVQRAGGGAALAEDAYYYVEPSDDFSVRAARPSRVSTAGGAQIRLVGAGLDAAGLSVTVGGEAASVVGQGVGWASVTAPPHPPGAVDVQVDDGAGRRDGLVGAVMYVPTPQVDRVSPARADVAGGAAVTVEGSGFEGAQRVLFGGLAAPFTVESDDRISATVPAHAAGTVDVVVAGALSGRLVDGFSYTDTLRIDGFSPVRGSVAGNTYVEIRGRGFVEGVDVSFDGQPAASVEVLDSQTLAVRTPAHPSGAAEVVVAGPRASADAGQPYTYFNPGSRFGGAWGSAVRGAVNVTVFEMGGAPIDAAYVQLSTRADSVYRGRTNADGMLTLSGPEVYGEQVVTAAAPGYSSTTVQHVDAENITIFLSKPSQGTPPPSESATATIEGELSGLNKIRSVGPNETLMAIVRTTRTSPFSRQPDPGGGATVYANGAYTLQSRIGDLAVVALGGIYNDQTQQFEPLVMGVARYLVASQGQTLEVDIDLDIPLDQPVHFKVNNAQFSAVDGPTTNRVVPWMDFGFEGVFSAYLDAQGAADVVTAEHMPALDGQLDGVSLWAIGGSYTGTSGLPLAEAFRPDVTDTSQTVDLPAMPAIARIISPAAGQQPVDGLVTFEANSAVPADYYYVEVFDFSGQLVWECFLAGEATSFRFPDFPDFSDLPPQQRPVPYPGGSYQMIIFGIRQDGASVDDFGYSDLSLDAWQSYSESAQIISF